MSVTVVFKRVIAAVFLAFVLLAGLAGCDRSSDGPRREPEPVNPGGGKEEDDNKKPTGPGGGDRPGLNGNSLDFAAELGDATLRYVGGGNSMRFSSGGILFKTLRDGTREIIDLDRGLKVEVRPGVMRADSICPDASVRVDGKEVVMESFRMKKQTAEAVWYHAVDKESRDYVLVLP